MWNTLITLLTNLVMGYSVSEPVKLYEFKSWIQAFNCIDNFMCGLICGIAIVCIIVFLIKLLKNIAED